MMKIVFLGNMNNIVFAVAKRLHEKNYDVTFLIDAPKNFLLDRPESYEPELSGNYPAWIKEVIVKEGMRAIKFIYPNIFLKHIIQILDEYDVVFLNGFWISLGKYLKKDKWVINVFAGFDLEFADERNIDHYVKSFYNSSWRKIFPRFAVRSFYKKSIKAQAAGIRRADVVNYYPKGINIVGDELLESIKKGQSFKRLQLRGLICSQFPYAPPDPSKNKFVILSITRFFFLNKRNDNKRNDLMIKGIGEFIRQNKITKNLEIIFFEKGADLQAAKDMCEQEGISPFVRWTKQVSVDELTEYFKHCDVAFDQLGDQWIGAGLFSMLTGRPLIANARPEVFDQLTGEATPVCQATTVEEISSWLTRLYQNRNLIKTIGIKSREYVLNHYDLEKTVNFYTETFSEFRKMNKKDKVIAQVANN